MLLWWDGHALKVAERAIIISDAGCPNNHRRCILFLQKTFTSFMLDHAEAQAKFIKLGADLRCRL
ncbi:MAG TPA: hypothetical protein VNZ53_05030 [Steroidobacteraceae bacterium]|jgi:hypothetical protein|nr:hypothetical protein [Steroidobacteraceae bacterium]